MLRVRNGRGETEEEHSEDYMLEGEYEKLKRSHRVMQNDYQHYRDDCQRILKKQNYMLNMLGEEKDAVETDLKSMAQAIVKRRDEMNVQELQELCEEHNDSAKEIAEEMQKLHNIESQINTTMAMIPTAPPAAALTRTERTLPQCYVVSGITSTPAPPPVTSEMDHVTTDDASSLAELQITDIETQIAAENKKMGKYYRLIADHDRMQTQAVIFENRLQKATVHFNSQLTLNRKLREEIEHHRSERALYGDLYKRLSNEHQRAKEELVDTIEISTQAFEQRDEAHNKMAALKERREKDMQMHNSEMKDLLRMISHDEKVKEFIQIKSNERTEYKHEKAKRIKQRYEMRGPAADKILLDTYDAAFKNISEVTEEQNIDIIIDNFLQKEETNFALYNYANELSSESDALQAEINQLRDNIVEMSTMEMQQNKTWEDKMQTVESNVQTKNRELMESEQRLSEINHTLKKLCDHMTMIFDKIGCDETPIKSQLGGERGISENNVTRYLAHIESRAVELLKSTYYLKMRQSILEGELPLKLDIGQLEPSLRIVPVVIPPTSFEDDTLDDDDDVTPMKEAELRVRVETMLERNRIKGLKRDDSVSAVNKKIMKPTKKTLK